MDPDSGKPVLLYDGACSFCERESARLERWVGGAVRRESFRTSGTLERYPGVRREECERAMHLVEPDGRVWSGAAALARAIRTRPLFALFGWTYFLPGIRQIFDRVYARVARNRFQLSAAVCAEGTCRIHPHDARFHNG